MPVTGEAPSDGSITGEQGRQMRPRGQPIQETPDPNPTTRPNKPTISSTPTTKKTHFSSASKFRGLGCAAAASQQVSVPAVIMESADWAHVVTDLLLLSRVGLLAFKTDLVLLFFHIRV